VLLRWLRAFYPLPSALTDAYPCRYTIADLIQRDESTDTIVRQFGTHHNTWAVLKLLHREFRVISVGSTIRMAH